MLALSTNEGEGVFGGWTNVQLACISWTECLFVWHLVLQRSCARHVRCWLTNGISCLRLPTACVRFQSVVRVMNKWETWEDWVAGTKREGAKEEGRRTLRRECIKFVHSCQKTWRRHAILAFPSPDHLSDLCSVQVARSLLGHLQFHTEKRSLFSYIYTRGLVAPFIGA